jgi:hypothetical protein
MSGQDGAPTHNLHQSQVTIFGRSTSILLPDQFRALPVIPGAAEKEMFNAFFHIRMWIFGRFLRFASSRRFESSHFVHTSRRDAKNFCAKTYFYSFTKNTVQR